MRDRIAKAIWQRHYFEGDFPSWDEIRKMSFSPHVIADVATRQRLMMGMRYCYETADLIMMEIMSADA